MFRSLSFMHNTSATIAIVELLSYWIDHHFSFFVASMSWQVQ